MSEHKHPVVICDGYDPDLGCPGGAIELDIALGGFATIVGSETQLPPGWTGPAPGTDHTGLLPHRCPDCTAKHADTQEDRP